MFDQKNAVEYIDRLKARLVAADNKIAELNDRGAKAGQYIQEIGKVSRERITELHLAKRENKALQAKLDTANGAIRELNFEIDDLEDEIKSK